jgi:hypothetical protein
LNGKQIKGTSDGSLGSLDKLFLYDSLIGGTYRILTIIEVNYEYP